MSIQGAFAAMLCALALTLSAPAARAGSIEEDIAEGVKHAQAIADASRARLEAAPPCCDGYAQLDFAPARVKSKLELTAQSPVIQLDGGKTRAYALRVPKLRVGSQVGLVQVDRGTKLEKMQPVVMPMVVLLDEQYQEVGRLAPEKFDYYVGYGHRSVLKITPEIARARYAIVAANPVSSGRLLTREAQPGTYMMVGAIPVVTPDIPEFQVAYAPEGRLQINFDSRPGYLQRRAEGRP